MTEYGERRLVAVLACRNDGLRLYGKPLQTLCAESGTTILEYLVKNLQNQPEISEVVLAISERSSNYNYVDFARDKNLPYGIGDDIDVVGRIIHSLNNIQYTDIFRVTSESPFTHFDPLPQIWKEHIENNFDASFYDNIIDGCGFEIISKKSIERSHFSGKAKHRSEMCTLYIRENLNKFRVNKKFAEPHLFRQDLRLTVDHPEDLIVCRKVFKHFDLNNYGHNIEKIIQYLDANQHLIELVKPFSDAGYGSMYL